MFGDIPAVEEMGFALFAASAVVGRGSGRYVEISGTVTIGGTTAAFGTLLHADEHGALTIHAEVDLADLLKMIETITLAKRVINNCAHSDFDTAELDWMHT